MTGRLSVEEEVALFLERQEGTWGDADCSRIGAGAWVLLDRYYLSMMAYQGARGIDPEVIRAANEEFAPVPDAVVWLDIPASVALERIGEPRERDALRRKRAWRPAAACLYPSMLPGCSA